MTPLKRAVSRSCVGRVGKEREVFLTHVGGKKSTRTIHESNRAFVWRSALDDTNPHVFCRERRTNTRDLSSRSRVRACARLPPRGGGGGGGGGGEEDEKDFHDQYFIRRRRRVPPRESERGALELCCSRSCGLARVSFFDETRFALADRDPYATPTVATLDGWWESRSLEGAHADVLKLNAAFTEISNARRRAGVKKASLLACPFLG